MVLTRGEDDYNYDYDYGNEDDYTYIGETLEEVIITQNQIIMKQVAETMNGKS